MKKESIYFEINQGQIGQNSEYRFKSEYEAIQYATDFKANPRISNRHMDEENVEYWKNQTYTVQKVHSVVNIDIIKTI